MNAKFSWLHQTVRSPLTRLMPYVLFLISLKPAGHNDGVTSQVMRKEVKIEQPFCGLQIDGDISVMLTNDPPGTLIIEGNQKELDKIKPVIKDHVLLIDGYRKNMFAKLTLYLSAVTLQNIELNGNATIASMGCIRSGYLHMFLNGNIDVHVKSTGKLTFDAPREIELSWKTPVKKIK